MSVVANVAGRFQQNIAASAPTKGAIGLAVSGGGDSIAMMHLAATMIDPQRLFVFTINHGLRPEVAEEIALVAAQADALGLQHIIANWHWDRSGNLQAAARAGRWSALQALARENDVGTIWMGHTADDQIETFMMRLARGSGVDGLTAMQMGSQRDGLSIYRPLLNIGRAELRAWLHDQDISWCDDPSNEDAQFDRVRARQMFAQLSDLGLTSKRILQTIDHMQAAKGTLQQAAIAFANQHVLQVSGDLLIAPEALSLETSDAPRRVMAAALGWVGGSQYRPRFEQLLDAAKRARAGTTTTLGGCILTPDNDGNVRMTREAAATKPIAAPENTSAVIWDQRWSIAGPSDQALTIKALGDGIKQCPDWRRSGIPRTSLLASPSVWRGDTLIAAPLAGLTAEWSAQIVADFHSVVFAIEE